MINIKREFIRNTMNKEEKKFSSNSTVMRKLVSCVSNKDLINNDTSDIFVTKNLKNH